MAEFIEGAQALGEIVFNATPESSRQIVARLTAPAGRRGCFRAGNAAMTLGQVAKANPKFTNQVVTELRKWLQQSKPDYVHGCIAYALGEIVRTQPGHAEQLIQPLIAQLDEADPWAREHAASALHWATS